MQNYQTQNFQLWKEVFSNKIGGVFQQTMIRSGVSNQELDKEEAIGAKSFQLRATLRLQAIWSSKPDQN